MTDLVDLSATALARAIAARDVSAVEVLDAHLDRIGRWNPHVNAVIGLRDRGTLRAEAAERDVEVAHARRDGGTLGPLHGLPHAVKDLAEAAGLPFTVGSPIFAGRTGAVDAPAVRRVRAAGAVIVGKTNVPEFGFGSQTHNPVWGTTRNPWDLTRTPGGSSGGAAVALSARMLPSVDGSDYMGSLRNPAGFCHVLGFRPSFGRVPKPGFVAQMGETGPMGRAVADLRRLLGVMAGPDPAAPLARTDGPGSGPRHREGVAGLRVGWLGDLGGHLATEPGMLDVCRRAAGVLAGLGAHVEDAVVPFDLDRLWRAFLVWRWWNALELAPLHADPALRAQLKPEVVWEIEGGLALSAARVHAAAADRDAWHAAVVELFTRYDVLLAPSAQVFPFDAGLAWPGAIDGRPMDTYHRWMETVAPWTFAATPALGMPAGFDARGLPAGVQLIGPPGADAAVLDVGEAYETATRWVERVRPPEPG